GRTEFLRGSRADRLAVPRAAEGRLLNAPNGAGAGTLTVNGLRVEYTGVEDVTRPPAVTPFAPFTVGEYAQAVLALSVDAFGGQDPAGFTYSWDLDGDGVFGEAGPAAGRGDGTVAAP